MSFSASIPATAPTEFAAAVDAAQASPPLATDQGKTLFLKARECVKDIAALFDGNFPIQATISGHVCEESPGSSPYDSLSVYVTEVQPVVVESPGA